jgi:hypothetical protein
MRLSAPGGAVERVLIELRQDARARRRVHLYGVIAALTLGGAWTLISFLTEWRGRALAHDAAAMARHPDTPENAARIAALARTLANEQPGFGGSLPYWEARARILALAAARARTPQASEALYDRAEAAARRGLLISPVAAPIWKRLAEIEAARAGWANEPAQALAKTVREVAPADPEAAAWRAEFALAHWADLGADMRQPALADLARLDKLGGYWRKRAQDIAAAAPAEAHGELAAAAPTLAAPAKPVVAPAISEPASTHSP